MKKLQLCVFSAVTLGILSSCSSPDNFMTQPLMTADTLTVKVGQTATVTMTAPNRIVVTNYPNQTAVYSAFIYSEKAGQPSSTTSAPYFPAVGGGLQPGTEPSFFPVSSLLEVMSPVTGSSNVPPRSPVSQEGDLSKTTFVIKGKSVGTAVLRGGFHSSSVEYPTAFLRTPLNPEYDGKITIQVVP
jgi:hypothetical protein